MSIFDIKYRENLPDSAPKRATLTEYLLNINNVGNNINTFNDKVHYTPKLKPQRSKNLTKDTKSLFTTKSIVTFQSQSSFPLSKNIASDTNFSTQSYINSIRNSIDNPMVQQPLFTDRCYCYKDPLTNESDCDSCDTDPGNCLFDFYLDPFVLALPTAGYNSWHIDIQVFPIILESGQSFNFKLLTKENNPSLELTIDFVTTSCDVITYNFYGTNNIVDSYINPYEELYKIIFTIKTTDCTSTIIAQDETFSGCETPPTTPTTTTTSTIQPYFDMPL